MTASNGAQHTIWSQSFPGLVFPEAAVTLPEETEGTKPIVTPFPKRGAFHAPKHSADSTLAIFDGGECPGLEVPWIAKYGRRSMQVFSVQFGGPVFNLHVLDDIGFDGIRSRHDGGGVGV